MFGMEEKIADAKKRSQTEYDNYCEEVNILIMHYEDTRDRYNAQLALINQERLSLRDEMHNLYEFLLSIGGSLDRKLTVFDFKTESFAPNMNKKPVSSIPFPEFKDETFWNNSLITYGIHHQKNKENLAAFEQAIGNNALEYEKDLQKRTIELQYLMDATNIAEIYRNIIVVVRDTISQKVIPEMEFIQAFLYADSIRERTAENSDYEDVEPCSIVEYKNTPQDIHYQFVKNAFDFYDISVKFFTNAILTNIIGDRIVSTDEKNAFNDTIKAIKANISSLEGKKVI